MQSNKNKSIDFKSSVFTCNKLNCSGCGACAQICSKHAIDMVEDNEGFLFPILNQEKCVQCGLCDKICPEVNSHQSNVGEYKQCFAATNKDNDYSRMSATIGACTMMAEYVLSIGGYVFGVILDEDEWKAKHRCIDNYSLLQEARNSKYIQSDTGSTYSLAKQLLNKDKTILYIGTPCQIAGLKAFLQKEYKKLYTIDLICHGVYSYRLLQKEVDYWSCKFSRGKVSNFRFRSKEKYPWIYGGVINFDISNNKSNTHIEIHGSCSPLYRCYAYSGDGINYTLRESCYSCQFRDTNRFGDITIGDAWGMSKKRSELFQKKNLRKGISLILCNTLKGKFLLDHIDSQVNLVELSKNEAFSQDALKSSNRMIPKERYLIYNNLDNEDWGTLIEKNLHVNFDKLRTMYHIHEVKKTIKEVIEEMIFYNRWKR